MKLLERYASECGLQVNDQFLLETFYPIPAVKYITLHTSSGMAAKNYPYYAEVIAMLLPFLSKQDIQVVQIGGKDDQPIQGCIHLHGKTSLHQSGFIIKNALLHLGNDSWCAHRAGELGIPLVTLFGSTRASNHGAYRYNPDKTVFLESHRGGKMPTFSSQENPQTIAFIPPEQVANAVLGLLHLTPLFTHQSRLFGLIYAATLFELVPNSFPAPTFVPEAPMIVRMDYLFNEDVLLNLLKTGRKVNIMTKREINLAILTQFRQSILSYTHELDTTCPLQYVGTVRGVIPRHSFFTKEKDDAKVAALRYQFFDVCNVERVNDLTRDDYIGAAMTYLNWEGEQKRLDLSNELSYTGSRLRFKSNKYLLSDGRIFLSPAHMQRGIAIESLLHNTGDVIDDPEYFRDLNHHYIYYQS